MMKSEKKSYHFTKENGLAFEKGRFYIDKYFSVKTDAFSIISNHVKIDTYRWDVFYALKESLKEHGGKYCNDSKSWYLEDKQLEKWIKTQVPYGWFS